MHRAASVVVVLRSLPGLTLAPHASGRMVMSSMLLRSLGISLVMLASSLAGCSVNPTTGRTQFDALSRQDEIAIGEQGKTELTAEMGGELAQAQVKAYVAELGAKLLQPAIAIDPSLAELPWEFIVLDSDVVNAFALPGGKVFMSRGLAQRMTNEAQLVAVLGHEIGHVAARHANERFSRALGLALAVGVGGAIVGDGGASAQLVELAGQFGQIALMSYDREQENESDALGMRYMSAAGWNPIGARQVMEILASLDREGAPPEFLSTHPFPETRIRIISERLASEYPQWSGRDGEGVYPERFRERFLRPLAIGYPEGRDEDPWVRALAMSQGLCRCPQCP
jgi:predicted Zn-dependent protease